MAALKLENEKLKQEVEVWKKKLVQVGVSHGVKHFSTSAPAQSDVPSKPAETTAAAPAQEKKENKKAQEKKPKKEAGESIDFPLSAILLINVLY